MSAGIYVHIPFCIKKCNYCDFLSIPYDEALKDSYLSALKSEVRHSPCRGPVDTVFFGGGTPSLLSPGDIAGLLEVIREKFGLQDGAETTLELNPGTVDEDSLQAFLRGGVNRVSIGVQSMCERELRILGRVHSVSDSRQCLRSVARLFRNFSLDLIYGLPGQGVEELKNTLCGVMEFNPPHISAYELSIEDGTPFYRMVRDNAVTLPGEEEIAGFYDFVAQFLSGRGYAHYEISNYALTGFECKHNMKYWMREDYLGFGAGAHSFTGGRRSRNTSDIRGYIDMVNTVGNAMVEEAALTEPDALREEIFLKLRTRQGLKMGALGVSSELIGDLERTGCLFRLDDRIYLTDKGMLVSNRIIVEIMDSLERNGLLPESSAGGFD